MTRADNVVQIVLTCGVDRYFTFDTDAVAADFVTGISKCLPDGWLRVGDKTSKLSDSPT